MENKGWVKAQDLIITDTLQLDNEAQVSINDLRTETLEQEVTVYNFEVEDNHTYYVSESNVLCHNMCKVPANNSPKGSSRKGAFNAAKKSLGISKSQQPTKVIKQTFRQNGKIFTQRTYEFGNKVIRDDLLGHSFKGGVSFGRHFNAGIKSAGKFISNGMHFFY